MSSDGPLCGPCKSIQRIGGYAFRLSASVYVFSLSIIGLCTVYNNLRDWEYSKTFFLVSVGLIIYAIVRYLAKTALKGPFRVSNGWEFLGDKK